MRAGESESIVTDTSRFALTQTTEAERDPFEQMIQADTRGEATPEEAALLRHPDNLEAWRSGLVEMIRAIDAQLSHRKAEIQEFQNECHAGGRRMKQTFFDAKGQYMRWRAGAVRAKTSAHTRLREANTLLKAARVEAHQRRHESDEGRQGKRAVVYGRLLENLRDDLLWRDELFRPEAEAHRLAAINRIDAAFAEASRDRNGSAEEVSE